MNPEETSYWLLTGEWLEQILADDNGAEGVEPKMNFVRVVRPELISVHPVKYTIAMQMQRVGYSPIMVLQIHKDIYNWAQQQITIAQANENGGVVQPVEETVN